MLTTQEMLSIYQRPGGEYRLRVGFEYEVHCRERGGLLPPSSERLTEILSTAASIAHGQIQGEGIVHKVALPTGAMLSLEPGGQLEYSSAPVETFAACMSQLSDFVALLQKLAERFDLHWFFGGLDPVYGLADIPLRVPTERYQLMDRYFARLGSLGQRMMRQTASVQVTFDYETPEVGRHLLRTAFFLSPFAATLFANSPYIDGHRGDYLNCRVPIWRETDPTRTGLIPGFVDPGFCFSDHLRHVVKAPMLFVYRGESLVDAEGMTFERFNREGLDGRHARLDDFALHNSTIFTDVRLKHTVEVRSVDAQDPEWVPAVLAFLSGLLLCGEARQRTAELLARVVTPDNWAKVPGLLARTGLRSKIDGWSVKEVALELIALARAGLARCLPDGAEAGGLLDQVEVLAKEGATPADVVLRRFDSARAWLAAGRTFSSIGYRGGL